MQVLYGCSDFEVELYENIGEAIHSMIKPKNNLDIKNKISFIICIEHEGASKKTKYSLGLLETVFLSAAVITSQPNYELTYFASGAKNTQLYSIQT